MEYVNRLVSMGYLDASAAATVQSQRDPPTHGIFSLQGGLGGAE